MSSLSFSLFDSGDEFFQAHWHTAQHAGDDGELEVSLNCIVTSASAGAKGVLRESKQDDSVGYLRSFSLSSHVTAELTALFSDIIHIV